MPGGYSFGKFKRQTQDAWSRAVGDTDGPHYTGSYFERVFVNPLVESVFSTVGGAAKGLWRGFTYQSPWKLSDYQGLWESLTPDRGFSGALTNLAAAPARLAGQAAGAAMTAVTWLPAAAVRALGAPLGRFAVGRANYLAAAAPGMTLGAAGQAVNMGLGAIELGINTGKAIWNGPLMRKTSHWSGAYGAKQFVPPVEAGILAAGAAAGLFKGGFAAFNAHRLGWVDTGQLAGTITEARQYGTVDRNSDPAWYDTDADGALVFALNRLRNR